MTLDEAIKNEEEVVEGNEHLAEFYYKEPGRNTALGDDCRELAEEHRQLAEWLKELKKYKEKDTPKLVIYSGDGYADGKMVYDWAECPNCSFTFEDGDTDWETKYCPNCGQALRWESEDKE